MNNAQPYLIPLAIVIAGGLVAAGIFFSGKKTETEVVTPQYQESQTTINVRDISSEDHILGNPNAKIKMVEFSDTECPYCKQFHTTLHQVVDTFGKDGSVAWVYRHFPIVQLHAKAPKEAEATECAYEQQGNDGFWKFTDEIYKRTPSNDGLAESELPKIAQDIGLNVATFNECLSSGKMAAKVEADFNDARNAGGRGTPYTVFVVSEEVGDEVVTFAHGANSAFNAQPGQEVVLVSSDRKKVSVSGALPYDFLADLIEVLRR